MSNITMTITLAESKLEDRCWYQKPDGSLVPLVKDDREPKQLGPPEGVEEELDAFEQECEKLGPPWV